jgi:hypothetical protein
MDDKLKTIVLNYLNDEYLGLIEFKSDKYPFDINYMRDGCYIIGYDTLHKYCYVSRNPVWDNLENLFNLKSYQVETIVKEWFESNYNFEVNAIYDNSIVMSYWIMCDYKNHIVNS